MSIWKKGKKWYTDWRDRQGKRHRKSYPTRSQAERADKGIKQWKRREGPKPREIPSAHLLADYAASKAHLCDATKKRSRKWAEETLLTIGQLPFSQLEPRHFSSLRERLGKYNFSSRRDRNSHVVRFLQWLHACGHLHQDPKQLWPPMKTETKIRTVIAEPETILRLKALADPLQLLILMLGYHAGLRREEIRRALVADFQAETYEPRLAIRCVKNTPITVVPISGLLAQYLTGLTDRQPPEKHLTAIVAASGRHVGLDRLNQAWKNLCDSAGITNLWIHDLRRTWATDLSEVASPSTLMQLGRWSKLRSIEPYLHSRPTEHRNAVDDLEARRQARVESYRESTGRTQ